MNVFPAQTNYFEEPRANGSFDYNCNMTEEREFETLNCSGSFCSKTNVFLGDPMKPAACGSMANFGDCSGVSCQASNLTVKLMRCR